MRSIEFLRKVPWNISKDQFERYVTSFFHERMDVIRDDYKYYKEIPDSLVNLENKTLEEFAQDELPNLSVTEPLSILRSQEGKKDVIDFLESNSEFYNRYLWPMQEWYAEFVSEDYYGNNNIIVLDFIEAYENNILSDNNKQFQDKIDINSIDYKKERYNPFGKPDRATEEAEEIRRIWAIALQRKTKNNIAEVDQARYDFFIIYNTKDPDEIAEILETTKSKINKKLRNWTLYKASARNTHKFINAGVDEDYQWYGLVNSNFIVKAKVNPEDLDNFFKEINTSEKIKNSYYGNQGEVLRSYILRTVMAIDTNIDYSDLSFDIKELERAGGQYNPYQNKITISQMSKHTIAHEIGHYLDRKWKKQFEFLSTNLFLSQEHYHSDIESSDNLDEVKRWIGRYTEFIDDLEKVSSMRSSYYASRIEVFARFVSYFVRWTTDQIGERDYDQYLHVYKRHDDKFNESHCRKFVRLLQEKSYIDSLVESQMSSQKTAKTKIIKQAEKNIDEEKIINLNLDDSCINSGSVAIALNRELFDNKGKYLVAVNRKNNKIHYVALQIDNKLYDANGEIDESDLVEWVFQNEETHDVDPILVDFSTEQETIILANMNPRLRPESFIKKINFQTKSS